MGNNVIPLQQFRPGSSTLKEMHLAITDEAGHFPFITFRTLINGVPLIAVTIPWARFREFPDNPTLYEVRSCDCEGGICGHPPQRLYMAKSLLHEWKLDSNVMTHYIFDHQIHDLGR